MLLSPWSKRSDRPVASWRKVECSLVFFRLIERLAIGAEDDHTQALLPKALAELHSLLSCILFGSERFCYPIDVDGADNIHQYTPSLVRRHVYQLAAGTVGKVDDGPGVQE
jgi:hypothetical protein